MCCKCQLLNDIFVGHSRISLEAEAERTRGKEGGGGTFSICGNPGKRTLRRGGKFYLF